MSKRKTGLARLPNGWEHTISQEYLSGASDVEIRAKLRITKKFWDILMSDPETIEFREIVDFGRMLSKAWWMGQARENLNERTFNSTLWYTYMKNMFGWSERTTTTTKTAEDMTGDELDARIEEALKKFRKVHKG